MKKFTVDSEQFTVKRREYPRPMTVRTGLQTCPHTPELQTVNCKP